MGNRLIYERFLWFHEEARAGRFPNAVRLANRFEYSVKQARRDIEFLRDRLGAPLEYDPHAKGYRYAKDSFELPATWLNSQELIALILARAALERLVSTRALPELDALRERLADYGFLLPPGTPDPSGMLSIHNPEWATEDPEVVGACLTALLNRWRLPIRYFAAGKGKTTERVVRPYHLLHHDGGWHLIAHCELRDGVRDFALSRIEQAGPPADRFSPDPLFDAEAYLERSFGIFRGQGEHQVRMRFNPFRARWVRRQRWHHNQHIEEHGDGSLTLSLPVSHFPELKMELLKFGADCEVLEPEALRRDVAAEARRVVELYAS